MKRSQISYATVMIMMAVVLSMAMLPLGAQDDWPGGCQLPDLEEVMNAANSAQAEGDVAAYVNSLSEINRQADKALKDCLAAAVEADVDLRETDLSYAHLQGGIRGGWVSPQLQEADLSYANLSESGFLVANLQGADLSHATLLGSGLTDANLQEARLSYASLLGTYFVRSNLQGANFMSADLRGAILSFANLQGAVLAGADLRGAWLDVAHLREANFTNAIFDETTVLPDAECQGTGVERVCDGYWTPDTDMARFTDPEHPDFWDPCVEMDELPGYCEDSEE